MTEQADRHHRLIAGNIEGGRVRHPALRAGFNDGYILGRADGEASERRRWQTPRESRGPAVLLIAGALVLAVGSFGFGRCSVGAEVATTATTDVAK
jgi:hypothetical protein